MNKTTTTLTTTLAGVIEEETIKRVARGVVAPWQTSRHTQLATGGGTLTLSYLGCHCSSIAVLIE